MTAEKIKICQDCKWFVAEGAGECDHQHNKKPNFVTGGTLRRLMCQDSREMTGDNWCNPQGKHWEAV